MKKTLLIIMALAGLFLSASVSEVKAQDYFYYYQGTKIPLTLNKNKVCVSIPKENDETIEKIHANVKVLYTIKDKTFDIIVIYLSDFEKLTSQDFWKEDAKSVILTSIYYTENNVEVFSTPYLTVRLKKEEDIDLLTSYAETYSLNIVGNSRYMPLWYTLNITSESEKSSLQCANEIYESGDFAASVADLASSGYDYEAETVRSITTTHQPSPTYDLQGRKLSNSKWSNGQIRKGIYIKDGRKFVVK